MTSPLLTVTDAHGVADRVVVAGGDVAAVDVAVVDHQPVAVAGVVVALGHPAVVRGPERGAAAGAEVGAVVQLPVVQDRMEAASVRGGDRPGPGRRTVAGATTGTRARADAGALRGPIGWTCEGLEPAEPRELLRAFCARRAAALPLALAIRTAMRCSTEAGLAGSARRNRALSLATSLRGRLLGMPPLGE